MPAAKTALKKWIGLNDVNQDLTFEWTDNAFVGYTYWGPNQPVRYMDDKRACVYVDESAYWFLDDCGATLSSVCKRPQEIVAVSPTPDGCSEVILFRVVFARLFYWLSIQSLFQSQVAFEGSCYELNHNYATFDEATADCAGNGGHLVAINTQ